MKSRVFPKKWEKQHQLVSCKCHHSFANLILLAEPEKSCIGLFKYYLPFWEYILDNFQLRRVIRKVTIRVTFFTGGQQNSRSLLAVCGCMRVCDISLELSWSPHEHMIGGLSFARTVRPQGTKTCFLLSVRPSGVRHKIRIV